MTKLKEIEGKARNGINPWKLEIFDLVEKLLDELDENADLLKIVAEKFDITEEKVKEIHTEVLLDLHESVNIYRGMYNV